MKAMISELVAKADLTEAQATKVADVVKTFLKSKLPDAVHGPLDAALTGERIDAAADVAKNLLGKLF